MILQLGSRLSEIVVQVLVQCYTSFAMSNQIHLNGRLKLNFELCCADSFQWKVKVSLSDACASFSFEL